VFLLRAVGDFRLVGFFKRVRGTPFARWDTRLFSPLCVALGLASLWVARPLPGGTAMAASDAAARLDHILIGVADLDAGRAWLAKATGVEPVYGGKHPTGTHNALLSLGDGTYLELIAPQPGTPAQTPYGDFARLTTPQPIGLAVAGGAIEPLRRRLESAGFALTAPQAGSRITPAGATLRWQAFGMEREVRQAPFFIVWSADSPHPSTTSPAGCTLRRFALAGPDHADLERLRAALDLDILVSPADTPSFEVELDCPAGPITLRNRNTGTATRD
jgi:catechol 2,3-dioxygenase-like lactoylglutathione lyase family enzyme